MLFFWKTELCRSEFGLALGLGALFDEIESELVLELNVDRGNHDPLH